MVCQAVRRLPVDGIGGRQELRPVAHREDRLVGARELIGEAHRALVGAKVVG